MAENLLLKWAAEQDGQNIDADADNLVDEERDSLPEDWRLEQSTSTRKYFYFNEKSRERYWKVDGAPAGWGFHVVGKRKEYINIMNGEKTRQKEWLNVPKSVHGLPPAWSLEFSKSAGKPYYYNRETKTTFWRDPNDREGFAYKLLPGGEKECFHVVTGEVYKTTDFIISKTPGSKRPSKGESGKKAATDGVEQGGAKKAKRKTEDGAVEDGEILEDGEIDDGDGAGWNNTGKAQMSGYGWATEQGNPAGQTGHYRRNPRRHTGDAYNASSNYGDDGNRGGSWGETGRGGGWGGRDHGGSWGERSRGESWSERDRGGSYGERPRGDSYGERDRSRSPLSR